MQRNTVIWAVVLIVVGLALLLNTTGVIAVNVWGLIWALVLLAGGVWILLRVLGKQPEAVVEEATLPLEGAGEARIRFSHGAGRLEVGAGAPADVLATGTFRGGVERQVQRQGDALDVHLQVSERGKGVFMPWNWNPSASLDWRVSLNGEVPLALDFETDAGESRLDLTDLRVADLRVKTEASSTEIDLPAHAGHTNAKIDAGAASVVVRVPAGVAARIQAQGGLSGVSVDLARFPRMGAVYQSEDYASAANRVDLHMDIGLGSVDVK